MVEGLGTQRPYEPTSNLFQFMLKGGWVPEHIAYLQPIVLNHKEQGPTSNYCCTPFKRPDVPSGKSCELLTIWHIVQPKLSSLASNQ